MALGDLQFAFKPPLANETLAAAHHKLAYRRLAWQRPAEIRSFL